MAANYGDDDAFSVYGGDIEAQLTQMRANTIENLRKELGFASNDAAVQDQEGTPTQDQSLAYAPPGQAPESIFIGDNGRGLTNDAARLLAGRQNRINTDDSIVYSAEEHGDPSLPNKWAMVGRPAPDPASADASTNDNAGPAQVPVSVFIGDNGRGLTNDAARLLVGRQNRLNTNDSIMYSAEEHGDPTLPNKWAVVGRKLDATGDADAPVPTDDTALQDQAMKLGLGPLTPRAAQERMSIAAERMVAELEPKLVNVGQNTQSPRSFLSQFNQGMTKDSNPAQTKSIIEDNINAYLNKAKMYAQNRFGDDNSIMPALAQNAAIVKIYGAVGKEMPDFQWTSVGAFMAHQVRDEILNVYNSVNTTTAVGSAVLPLAIKMGMTSFNEARDHMINKLIQGQRDVVTDIVAMGLAYREYGAEAMSQKSTGFDDSARNAFTLQAQADRERDAGHTSLAEASAREAAYQLGLHEQQRLQPMWEDPMLNAMGKINGMMLQSGWPLSAVARPLDIYVGANKYLDKPDQSLGYISAPTNMPNMDVTQLKTRLQIARNAFDSMWQARQDPKKYNTLQSLFDKMYDGSQLYKLHSDQQPQSWSNI